MLCSLRFPTSSCSSSSSGGAAAATSPVSASPQSPLYIKFRTSHRENIRRLKSLGIIDPRAKPRDLPSPDAVDGVLAVVDFLSSKGFAEPDFPRLASACPEVFTPHFDPAYLEPAFEFLSADLSASAEESRGLILRCPRILLANAEHCLRPTLEFLRQVGVQNLSSPTNLNAHLLNTRADKLAAKVRFLRGVGFSYEEATRTCARMPAIFGYSIDNNLRPKIDYLVGEMGRGLEELKAFPQYFAFSLPGRIAPRHLHLKRRNVRVPLKRMLIWSDERFYAKWK